MVGGAHAQPAEVRRYVIPAGELTESMKAFGLQSGLQLLAPPELTRGLRGRTVQGEYSARAALDALLSGSGLTYEFVNGETVVIRRAPAPAARAVPVRLGGNEAGSPPVDMASVEVTGSRLKRTDYEGPSPVIVISREDIDRSGHATVRQVLAALPQASVAGDESGAATFNGAATVQLRGLSHGSTLILVNGRRVTASSLQAGYNFFDLNSIPIEVVERIEVLTDTASAIYGGDAIGGAVNFVLKRGFEGAVASARYGTSYRGDASEMSGSVTLGGASERFSGLLVLDRFERDPMYASDRELTSSLDYRRYGGRDARTNAGYPANVYALPGTGNLPGLNATSAGAPAGGDGLGLTPADFAAGVLNRNDPTRFNAKVPHARRDGLFATGRYGAASGFSLFTEVLYSRNRQISEMSPAGISGGANGAYRVGANNPFNPFGVAVGVDYSFYELGSRTVDGTVEYLRTLFGVEGRWGESDWQVTYHRDRNDGIAYERNFLRTALVQQYLDSSDPAVALNVFSGTGGNNPATLDALRQTNVSLSAGTSSSLEAVLTGKLRTWGPLLSYALGAATRREALYWNVPSMVIDAGREADSAFLEVSLPLLEDAGRRLELSFAGRYDRYSDFGSSFNPQFGVAWKPSAGLLLRASAGTAFKAPSLYDLYAPPLLFAGSVVTDPLRGGEQALVDQRYGGNPDVQPENATSYTLGFIYEPTFAPGLALGASVFRVVQEDFINRTLPVEVMLRHSNLFAGRVVREAPTAEDIAAGRPGRLVSLNRTPVNFGEVDVRGIDVQARQAFAPGAWGSFVWTLGGSYVDSYKVVMLPGDPAVEQVGVANSAGYPTRFKGNTGLSWASGGALNASVLARYLHGYRDYGGASALPPQWWFDAQLSYDFGRVGATGKGPVVTLGAINLGNNQGRYSNSGSGYDFLQADLRGRFFYMNLKYAF